MHHYGCSGLDVLTSSSGRECALGSVQCCVDSPSIPLKYSPHWVSSMYLLSESATKCPCTMFPLELSRVAEFGMSDGISAAKASQGWS